MKLNKTNNKETIRSVDTNKVYYVDLDPRGDPLENSLISTTKLNIVHIGTKEHQTTQVKTMLLEIEEAEIVQLLPKNVDLFAWVPADMLRIDRYVICH